MTYTIQELRDKNIIIFESLAGSHAYGTSTPKSDKDIRGVFVQPIQDVLKHGFIDQVSDKTNDVIFYELGRFIDLLIKNNPNILEMLVMPNDCVIYRDPMFSILEACKPNFLTKRVRWTFAGYAIDQIKKARGYNKKMNWEESEMTRKGVLDFCYIINDAETIPLKEYLEEFNKYSIDQYTQEDFSLAKIDHAHDIYAMYLTPGGIVKDVNKANDVQLTSIPKGVPLHEYLTFNKDAYSTHCKRYAEYQTWLKERNENRYKMNKEHGKNYDSKNMMHTYRLLLMAHELAKGELRVRRTEEEVEKLMKIRKGEYEYDDLLNEAEEMIATLDEAFEVSNLPEKVNKTYVYNVLLDLRKYYYNL
jgi:uncharacterized protein